MKSARILLFLFCFVFLLGPKTIWHAQAHEHDSHEMVIKKNSSESNIEEDCFACDFDLGLFTTAGFFQFLIPLKISSFVNCSSEKKEANSFLQFNFLRGPPNLI